ncbi:glycoside hydrolase family 43 protein [Actinoplanes sp. CA-054009]
MTNPILPGFHPDPSICRAGRDYYLICSSFEYVPGVPIFHSRDLEHWEQIGNALDGPFPAAIPSSGGIYAPTIRHHDGLFWIITTDTTGGGTFIVTAADPAGPWSEPVWVDLPGIDPDLAWDDEGNCWCAVSGIQVARIDPVAGKVLDGPHPVWAGTGLQYPEAPHLYRVGDWWYLMIAEGGTERGHTVAMARARHPLGPYEPAPGNPILTHRSTDLPVQSTGHADLVETPDGDWWMVLLGTRPRGKTPAFHVLGRETFLTRVRWADGWPVVAPVVSSPPVINFRDDFDAAVLAPQWISPRRRPDHSLSARPGWLTLHGPGFLGIRQQQHDTRVTTRLDPGSATAGLSIRMDDEHHYDLEISEGQARVVVRIGPLRQSVATRPVPPGPVELTVDIRAADTGPDTVSFHLGDGPALATVDGRYLSTEVVTGFTGRVIGLYASSGAAAFDWYQVTPSGPAAPA